MNIHIFIAPAGQATGAPAPTKKAEEKKPEKKEEEAADVGVGGLFGDEYWYSFNYLSAFLQIQLITYISTSFFIIKVSILHYILIIKQKNWSINIELI